MQTYGEVLRPFADRLPAVALALVVLFVGWLLARLVSGLIGRLAARLTHRASVKGLVEAKEGRQIDRIVSKIAFYALMVFVLLQFLDVLGVGGIRDPLLSIANELALAVPNLAKALLILLAAWIAAAVLRSAISRLIGSDRVCRALLRIGVIEEESQNAIIATSAGSLSYYLVLLVFLPAVLGALQLEGLQDPFEQVVVHALSFLPRLVAAAVTLFVGYVAARVVQGIAANFLASTGIDELPAKVGVDQLFREKPLSASLGVVLSVLILIPVSISALESLGVSAISGPAISMLTGILNMVPNIAVAVFLTAIGVVLARWVGRLTGSLLQAAAVPAFLMKWGLIVDEEKSRELPGLIGRAVAGVVLLLTLVETFDVLRLQQISAVLQSILAYIPHVLVAVVVLGIGYAVGRSVQRGLATALERTAYPVWLGTVAKSAILVLASTMALEQLGVAESVVVAAFTILAGSMGLALAIAVGLGTKDIVHNLLAEKTAACAKSEADREPRDG